MDEVISVLVVFVVFGTEPVVLRRAVGCRAREQPHEYLFACLLWTFNYSGGRVLAKPNLTGTKTAESINDCTTDIVLIG